jgi:hypothetical protein
MPRRTHTRTTRLKPGLHRLPTALGPTWAGHRPEPQARLNPEPVADNPKARSRAFSVLFREAIEAREAETGREATGEERYAIKLTVREAHPDLAWDTTTNAPPQAAEETTP